MEVEEKLTETFNMLLSAETRQQLDELAASEHRSRGEYLRLLIQREHRFFKDDMAVSRAQVKKTLGRVEDLLERLKKAIDEDNFDEEHV